MRRARKPDLAYEVVQAEKAGRDLIDALRKIPPPRRQADPTISNASVFNDVDTCAAQLADALRAVERARRLVNKDPTTTTFVSARPTFKIDILPGKLRFKVPT